MTKPKRKLTAQQRAEKKRRRQEYMTIFIRGKQKRVRRPPTIDGIPEEEFIRNNADNLWYHQNEMWDQIELDPAHADDAVMPNKPLQPTRRTTPRG
jgi:hypothetical protein